MQIESIRIKNLRSYKDAVVNLSDYSCLVGANGCGKSTVLFALNVFFGAAEYSSTSITSLSKEDFHAKDTTDPVEVIVTFVNLSPDAIKDFSAYYRAGKLIVKAKAVYDIVSERASVVSYGIRLGIEDFAPYFKLKGDKGKKPELTVAYEEIRKKYALKEPGTIPQMTQALEEYEAANPRLHVELESKDDFYGVTKGRHKFANHIQWVFIPAQLDANEENAESGSVALRELLNRTVRLKTTFQDDIEALKQKTLKDYKDIVVKNRSALTDLLGLLNNKVQELAHPDAGVDLEWEHQQDKSVNIQPPTAKLKAKEHSFSGEIPRFGHGLQRSYIMALLQLLASTEVNPKAPKLILGCEEPELFQHPPQILQLATVLENLSLTAQVIVTTHSPHMVSGKGFEAIRLVQKARTGGSAVRSATFDTVSKMIADAKGEPIKKATGMLAKVHSVLQTHLSELFFSPRLIFLEGIEDKAYLTAYLHRLDLWAEFRKKLCHFVVVERKSKMLYPIAIAQSLKIPFCAIIDSDGHTKPTPKAKHELDNKAIIKLCGETLTCFPDKTELTSSLVVWKDEIGEVVQKEITTEIWNKLGDKANKDYGDVGDLEKNPMHISTTLDYAWEAGHKSETLIKVCKHLLESLT